MAKYDTDDTKMAVTTDSKQNKVVTDREMYETIIKNFDFSKKSKDHLGLNKIWEKHEKNYQNKYWDGSVRPAHLFRFSSNELFEFVEVTMPIVASRIPKPDIVAEPTLEKVLEFDSMITSAAEAGEDYEPYIKEKKKYLSDLSDWVQQVQKELLKIYTNTNMLSKEQELYREHTIKGNSLILSKYDAKKNEVINEVLDLGAFYPDPTKESVQGCQKSWLILGTYKTVKDIKDEFGVDVEPEGDFDIDGTFRFYSRMKKAKETLQNIYDTSKTKQGWALVLYYYCEDFTQEDVELFEEDSEGKWKIDAETGERKTYKESKHKYPYGRVIVIVRSLKYQILEDYPNPYNRFPLFLTTNYKRSGDIWGTSDGLNIESHIHAKNMLMSNIIDNIRFTGNPQKEVVVGQMVSDGEEDGDKAIPNITNEPGKMYPVTVPGTINNLPPPSIPNYIERILQYIDLDRDRKTGINDALRGESASGDSGVKTQALIGMATGRMQPKLNAFIELARELYEHWAWIIRHQYPDAVLQKDEDEEGNASYTLFDPKKFEDVVLHIEISALSVIPFDSFAEFEEAVTISRLGIELYGRPGASMEQLIDTTAMLRDKRRWKDGWNEITKQFDRKKQSDEAREHFIGLIETYTKASSEENPDPKLVAKTIQTMISQIAEFPELLVAPEYLSLPASFRVNVIKTLSGIEGMVFEEERPQQNVQQQITQ